jgi:hypothetical protein
MKGIPNRLKNELWGKEEGIEIDESESYMSNGKKKGK